MDSACNLLVAERALYLFQIAQILHIVKSHGRSRLLKLRIRLVEGSLIDRAELVSRQKISSSGFSVERKALGEEGIIVSNVVFQLPTVDALRETLPAQSRLDFREGDFECPF